MIDVTDVLERLALREAEKAARLRAAYGEELVSTSQGLLNLSRASIYRVAAQDERAKTAMKVR